MVYNYDEISRLYDDVREADVQTADFLAKRGRLDSNSKFLEIGCGTGNYLKVVQKLTNAEAWGLDSSEGMLEKAGQKCPEAKLSHGNATELRDIPDNTFDLVYMVDVIHHIKDIDTMFKSIKRVLKHGAPVIIITDSHEHIKNRLTSKYFPGTIKAELARYQDIEELIQTFSTNDYHSIEHGALTLPSEQNYGAKLIEIAEKKGYSMFEFITDEEIKAGIQRIKDDMAKGPVVYLQRAPYVMGVK